MNNIWSVIWIFFLGLTLITSIFFAGSFLVKYMEYEKWVIENTPKNIKWNFNCNDQWNSHWYNCPLNESFKNLSGQYCYGKMICQNDYEVRE